MTEIPLGVYEMDGQVPIVVTDNGDLGNGMFGPWVHYRFEWEAEAKAVLRWTFKELMKAGYRPRLDTPSGPR